MPGAERLREPERADDGWMAPSSASASRRARGAGLGSVATPLLGDSSPVHESFLQFSEYCVKGR
jgi:hypothetical protein